MGRRIGPAKIKQYSLEFKLKAVQLSSQPGVLIKDVAESLCIHPFMLSMMEHDLSKKSYPVCLRTKSEVFAFIEANRQTYPVQMMCDLHGVSRAGFYAWVKREASERQRTDQDLIRSASLGSVASS